MTVEQVGVFSALALLAGCLVITALLVLARVLKDRAELRRQHVRSSVWRIVLGLPDLFRAIYAAVEENIGYRQLNAWWRLGGIVEVLRRRTHHWGDMQRAGFDQT